MRESRRDRLVRLPGRGCAGPFDQTLGMSVVRLSVSGRRSVNRLTANEAVAAIEDHDVRRHAERYLERLGLGGEPLAITTDRLTFEQLLGRRVNSAIGGGYVYHPRRKLHLILINLPRIDRSQPNALEIVVAEEFLHMRDWIDGDRRRHAKHGYDRIAHRVSELTGASLEEIRSCLLPQARRPVRYHYRCPGCSRLVERRRKGVWSCGRCASGFDARYVLVLERDLKLSPEAAVTVAEPAGSSPRRSR